MWIGIREEEEEELISDPLNQLMKMDKTNLKYTLPTIEEPTN